MVHIEDDQFFKQLFAQSESSEADLSGPYKILYEIARGGQGIVYKAIDTRTNASIALKQSYGVSGNLGARLSRGAELSQLLDHPYILPTLETKFEQDSFWIVMPWIDGVSLDVWCNEQGDGIDVKIAMFFRICDAIVHAHGRGVIHRDIRPANVLVNTKGFPCVLDFGMAKRVELAGHTHTVTASESAGDIHFLAPEMLDEKRPVANIGQDVYALGILLYTMLKGSHPLDGLPFGECVSRVTSVGVFTSDIDRHLPRSLGSIIRKATSTDLNARYNSVWDLVEDVRNDTKGRPVRACVHTKRYLCGRFISRHRVFLTVAIAVGIVAIASSVMLGRVIEKERSTRAAKMQALHLYAGLLDSLNPGGEVGPSGDGMSVLNYASEQVQSISIGDSRVEMLAIAGVHLAIAHNYSRIRQGSMGESHAEEAYRIYGKVLGKDDDRTLQAGGLFVYTMAVEGKLRKAMDTMQAMHEDLSPGGIKNSQQLLNMAVVLSKLSPIGSADPYYEEYFARSSVSTECRAFALEQRSAYLNRSGFPQRALIDSEESYRIRLAIFGPDTPPTLTSQLFMAKSLQLLGRFDEVRQLMQTIMPAIEFVFGEYDYRTLRGRAHMTIANVELGFAEQGYESAQQILTISREHHSEGSFVVVQGKFLVVHALLALERPSEAITLLEQEIETIESQVDSRPDMKYMPRYWVARAYNDLGEYEWAEGLLQVAIPNLEATLGPDNWQTLLCKYEHLQSLAGMGRDNGLAEAAGQLETSFIQRFGQYHPYTDEVRVFAMAQRDGQTKSP